MRRLYRVSIKTNTIIEFLYVHLTFLQLYTFYRKLSTQIYLMKILIKHVQRGIKTCSFSLTFVRSTFGGFSLTKNRSAISFF